MSKKIVLLLLCVFCGFTILTGCNSKKNTTDSETDSAVNDSDGETVSETGTNGEITSVTLNDLKDYIDLDGSIYVVQGASLNGASSFSYDSSVIKSVTLDTSGINTNITPGELGTKYDADYEIVVDVDNLCKKENKTNGMTGDTAQVSGTITVTVITRDWADSMIENGASASKIIGY